MSLLKEPMDERYFSCSELDNSKLCVFVEMITDVESVWQGSTSSSKTGFERSPAKWVVRSWLQLRSLKKHALWSTLGEA